MSRSAGFDITTSAIEDYIQANERAIRAEEKSLISQISMPLKHGAHSKTDTRRTQDLLSNCTSVANQLIKEVCEKRSIDLWLSVLRRFPLKTPFFGQSDWQIFATLAILKWSDWAIDSTLGQVNYEDTYGVALLITEEDIENCFKIAMLANQIATLLSLSRRLGKGSKLVIRKDGSFEEKIDSLTQNAIDKYEMRRPRTSILHDAGTPAGIPHIVDVSEAAPLGIFLRPLNRGLPVFFAKNNLTLFFINYFPHFTDMAQIKTLLASYEDAIQDTFGIETSAIVQVYYALAQNIMNTLPWEIFADFEKDHFSSQLDIKQDMNVWGKVNFAFALCQRGYLRFPAQIWRKRLASPVCPGLGISRKQAQDMVDRFLAKFMLTEDARNEINIIKARPMPLIFTSPGGNCYLDLTMLVGFLHDVILAAKDWFSSQHGDRFTLYVKNLIDETVPVVRVVGWKQTYKSQSGAIAEADLIVQKGSRLFVIECKAPEKTVEFLGGNISAVQRRNKKVGEAVKQAKNASEIITECWHENSQIFDNVGTIEWIVCTPTQEFLKPFEKYGMLTSLIPKVCTHEELTVFLAEAAEG